MSTEQTLFDRIGGEATFEQLVSHFYALVSVNPILRPMYPDDDFQAAAERLMLFLIQYWGGPHTYSEMRGHPRLRMRHAQFLIDSKARDAWLACMKSAVDELKIEESDRVELWNYLEMAAQSLVNTPDH
ncbi:MAG: globin [Actinobacteria bacterium]|nr:globin [Actinomycetota bacterium]